MKQKKMLFVAMAACLLFSTADVFSQRSRVGGLSSSGGHMGGSAPRSVSTRTFSSGGGSSSGGSSSGGYSSGGGGSSYSSSNASVCKLGGYVGHCSDFKSPGPSLSLPNSREMEWPSSYRVAYDVIVEPCPEKEVSEKVATKRSFVISHPDGDFYYRDGSFYRKKNDKYVTHRPFVGFRVPDIPHFHYEFKKEGITYHYFNRTFYTYNESFDYYEVVAPPKDLLVAFIPSYSNRIAVGKNNFYIADGMKFLVIEGCGMPIFKIIEVDEAEYSKNNKVTYYSCH